MGNGKNAFIASSAKLNSQFNYRRYLESKPFYGEKERNSLLISF